jgi:hypothetical protein
MGLSPLEGRVEAEISSFIHIEEEDILLLCSNSLVEAIEDKWIEELLESGETSEQTARKLIDVANKKTEKEANIVLVVITVKNTKIEIPKVTSFHLKEYVLRKIRHSKINFRKVGVFLTIFTIAILISKIEFPLSRENPSDKVGDFKKVSEEFSPQFGYFNHNQNESNPENLFEEDGDLIEDSSNNQNTEMALDESINRETSIINFQDPQKVIKPKEENFQQEMYPQEDDLINFESNIGLEQNNELIPVHFSEDETQIIINDNNYIKEDEGEKDQEINANNKNNEISIEEQIEASDRSLMELWNNP